MGKARLVFGLWLGLLFVGCASAPLFLQPSSNFGEVCAAPAPVSIVGKWQLTGQNGRQLPDYFPELFLSASETQLSHGSATTGKFNFHLEGCLAESYDENDLEPNRDRIVEGLTIDSPEYTIENGRLQGQCAYSQLAFGRRFKQNARQIRAIQSTIDTVFPSKPRLGRLANQLCLTGDNGQTLEYVLRDE